MKTRIFAGAYSSGKIDPRNHRKDVYKRQTPERAIAGFLEEGVKEVIVKRGNQGAVSYTHLFLRRSAQPLFRKTPAL